MSLFLPHNYEDHLRETKPISINSQKHIIPPVNTDIRFDILPKFKVKKFQGLASLDYIQIPKNFNWKDDGDERKHLMAIPGNQMLCGSCWAISAAGIIADNFVISKIVNWKPNLSTTWCLACYPQLQCKGGNPAILYKDISENGIASNHCIDYSWCSKNPLCNGKATKHLDKSNEQLDLSDLIPSCGCYNSKVSHYLYYIDEPQFISLNDEIHEDFTKTIKKHIYHNGPVQGGFLVFKNFINGAFTKINGGVYLENGVYNSGKFYFDDQQLDQSNYMGAHAVAIIGWGIENGVVIDNSGKKENIPYWYCRNSWTTKWGNGGYFKMAMYPYNQIVQFDKSVVISTKNGNVNGGGMILFKTIRPPESKTLPQINKLFLDLVKEHPESYYTNEKHNVEIPAKPKSKLNILVLVVVCVLTIVLAVIIYSKIHLKD